MPPRTKKKNGVPSLSFVTSPTPSIIKFPHSESSQSQPLKVPTVPYSEGGKWLSKHFTQADIMHTKLPGRRRRRKSKSDVIAGITPSNGKRKVVSGCELQHHSSRRSSSTSYVPLEVTVSSRTTIKKQHSRHGQKGKSDNVASNSSHSADKTMRAVNMEFDDATPLAFSVKTPELKSDSVDTMNSDKTLRFQASCSLSNLEVDCHGDFTMVESHRENNNFASPRRRGKCTLRLFQSSGSEDCDLEESEVLAPDTPEHEREFTFYQRQLKTRIRGVKQVC